jgi:iron complex transport system ATP-binding protein
MAVFERTGESRGWLRPVTSRQAALDEARDLLESLQLGGDGGALTRQLPYGKQRLLEIALALATRPRVLLLDEPAAGLDLGGREDLVARLSALALDPDAPALVLVTHHVEEIPPGFTHALLLRDGHAVVSGLVDDVITSENLSKTFDQDLVLERSGDRFFARRR